MAAGVDAGSWRLGIRVTLEIDDAFLRQCKDAYVIIKQWTKLADLGEFFPQTRPEILMDTTKYLVEL